MSIQMSNRLIARFEQAAQEEAAVAACRRGCPARCGRGRAAQVLAPVAERGRATTTGAAPRPVGQVAGEDEAEGEDEEVETEPAPQPRRGGRNNSQQETPSPPPNLAKVKATQT